MPSGLKLIIIHGSYKMYATIFFCKTEDVYISNTVSHSYTHHPPPPLIYPPPCMYSVRQRIYMYWFTPYITPGSYTHPQRSPPTLYFLLSQRTASVKSLNPECLHAKHSSKLTTTTRTLNLHNSESLFSFNSVIISVCISFSVCRIFNHDP